MKKLYFTLFAMMCFTFSFGQIADGGFEGGIGATWTEASTNFGTPLCDAGCGTCGGYCFPKSGSFYAWFGGAGGVTETGSVEQSATIPSGTTATIDMEVKMPTPGPGVAGDKLEVKIDGNVVGTITALDSASYITAYALASFDISAYADGGSHTIRIEGIQSTTAVFNVLVDDIRMSIDGVSLALNDFENSTVTMYPNPANDILNIGFAATEGITTIQITDLSGKVISTQDVQVTNGQVFQMDLDNYANGVYMVRVVKDGVQIMNEKFVVAK